MTARLTVAEIRAAKGKRQFTMLRIVTWDELAAAAAARIDMVSVPPEMMVDPRFRDVAPTIFAVPGMNYFDLAEDDDFLRWGYRMLRASADAVYCSAGLPTIRRLAEDGIPVVSHTGLIPSKRTWTGGFRAVGKTADSALSVLRSAWALEEAGAFGAEIEVVPAEMATEICRRTGLFMISMGSGVGGDCQYLFAEDVLGENRVHVPRHAKIYRDFKTEYDRLQRERIAAFGEFGADVASGAYPEQKHLVGTDPAELARFRQLADAAAAGR